MIFVIMTSRLTSRKCRPTPLCLESRSLVIVTMKGLVEKSATSYRSLEWTKPLRKMESSMAYPIAEAIVKIGRYIATTINPTVTPKNTIIIGSKSAVRFVTA